MSKVISAEAAARLIQDHDVCGFTTMCISGYCQEVADAITKRYQEEAHPKGLTAIHACGSGDYAHGSRRGINGLAREGLIDTIISGHIGGSFDMCDLIAENKVKSYLVPQGVVTHIYRDQASHGPGVITKVGLHTFADPRIEGCRTNDAAKESIVKILEIDGKEWMQYKVPPINVAIIRATTADEDGNLTNEREAVQFEILPLAMAAHNNGGIVIAQVERIALKGSLKNVNVRVPGILVDYIVVAEPDNHPQTWGYDYQPGLSGELLVPMSGVNKMSLSERKVIARRATMYLQKNTIVNLGLGMPDGISNIVVEEGVGGYITLTTELGTIGGVPGFGPYFGTAFNAEAYMRHYEMFDFYNGGGLDVTFLGISQVDANGSVNVSKIGGKPNGPGGFVNITQNTKRIVFMGTFSAGAKLAIQDGRLRIISEGKHKKWVKKLEQITFSGINAVENGQKVVYITERCVFELIDGKLTLTEIAEGIEPERDIYPMMEFRPTVAEKLRTMPAEIFCERWGNLKKCID